jgi:hypothetical protein
MSRNFKVGIGATIVGGIAGFALFRWLKNRREENIGNEKEDMPPERADELEKMKEHVERKAPVKDKLPNESTEQTRLEPIKEESTEELEGIKSPGAVKEETKQQDPQSETQPETQPETKLEPQPETKQPEETKPKLRIQSHLYEELKISSAESNYKMKLETLTKNADELKNTMETHGIKIKKISPYGETTIISAEGSGDKFFKLLDCGLIMGIDVMGMAYVMSHKKD